MADLETSHATLDHTGLTGVPGAGYTPGGTDVAVSDGGTGASSAATARSNLGISAANTPITDAGTYFTATDVEGALQELGAGSGGGGGSLSGSKVELSGGDITTSSTTFVDMTGASITVTTAGSVAVIGFTAASCNATSDAIVYFDIDVDGSRLGNATSGYTSHQQNVGGAYRTNVAFSVMATGLSAGSHTFKVKWRVSGGSATTRAGTSGESNAQMWVLYS